MKILHVDWGHPPNHLGIHPAMYVQELAEQFLARGHKNVLFAVSPLRVTGAQPYSVRRRRYGGVDTYSVASSGEESWNPMDPYLEIGNPECEKAFSSVVNQVQPDVVHFHSFKSLSASLIATTKSLEKPCVISVHDYRLLCPKRDLLDGNGNTCSGPGRGDKCADCVAGDETSEAQKSAFVERRDTIVSWINECADMLIANSSFARDVFIDQGISPAKVTAIAPTARTAERLWETQGSRAHSDGVLTFGFVGTVARRKAPHLLIEAARLLDDIRDKFQIAIHGQIEDDGYLREIEAKIQELGDPPSPDIEFAGHYSPEFLEQIFAGLDVCVAPTMWQSPRSRSMLEALGAGVPVIASMVGGVPEFIGHGYNGLLFERGNPVDLAEQMRYLIENPIILASMRANISAPKPLAWHAGEIEAVYKSVIARAKVAEPTTVETEAA